MANIRSLSDLKKQEKGGGGGRGGPPGGGFPGGGGGFPGFPGMPSMGGGSRANEKNIKWLKSDGQLAQELRSAGGKLVVVDFTASWCGPCQHIAPVFAEMSNKYTDVVFLKVDVDELQETAQRCGIRAMPTFQFYKNSSKVDEFSGADPEKLKSTIEKHRASSSGGSSSGSGFPSGGYVLGSSKTGATGGPSSGQPSQQPSFQPSQQAPAPAKAANDVDEVFLSNLMDMGFPKEKAQKALAATGGKSIEAAMDWCFNHADDEQGQTLGGSAPAAQPTSEPQKEAPKETSGETSQESTTATTPMETESTAPSSDEPTIHNALCNSCKEQIIGIRWKCAMCSDYDLCSACYDKRTHNPEHIFDAHEKDIENPEKKALTPEELEERKKQLAEKIRQKKLMRMEEEKQAEIEREKIRIKGGKEAQEAKKLWEQKTREREEALKRKEREEDRKAKLAIKQKIEQDRLNREAAKKANTQPQPQAQQAQPQQAAPAEPPAKKEYTEALIQIRFKDGNTIKATFKPTDSVRTVHSHAALLLGNDKFSLMTTFPRKVFSPRDASMDSTTLQQAECVPTGTFIVQ